MPIFDQRRANVECAAQLVRASFYFAADAFELTEEERRILTSVFSNDRTYYPIRRRRGIRSIKVKCLVKAPEKYRERPNREESPIAFTRRVYADYYFSGLNRGDLQRLDEDLWDALRRVERKHPDRRLVELPARAYSRKSPNRIPA